MRRRATWVSALPYTRLLLLLLLVVMIPVTGRIEIREKGGEVKTERSRFDSTRRACSTTSGAVAMRGLLRVC